MKNCLNVTDFQISYRSGEFIVQIKMDDESEFWVSSELLVL